MTMLPPSPFISDSAGVVMLPADTAAADADLRPIAAAVLNSALVPVIAVHLSHIRKRLLPTGYTITINDSNPRRGWRIVKLSQQED